LQGKQELGTSDQIQKKKQKLGKKNIEEKIIK
jgi:hypothetical protein